jgi:hypothetical protein
VIIDQIIVTDVVFVLLWGDTGPGYSFIGVYGSAEAARRDAQAREEKPIRWNTDGMDGWAGYSNWEIRREEVRTMTEDDEIDAVIASAGGDMQAIRCLLARAKKAEEDHLGRFLALRAEWEQLVPGCPKDTAGREFRLQWAPEESDDVRAVWVVSQHFDESSGGVVGVYSSAVAAMEAWPDDAWLPAEAGRFDAKSKFWAARDYGCWLELGEFEVDADGQE